MAKQETWQRYALLIRLAVGAVFLTEGVQKFIFPEALGVGRFARIGIPAPHFFAPFVAMVIAGLLTRMATIPLIIDMSVAIIATKLPLIAHEGFWHMAHESRVDYVMLLNLVYLLMF